MRRWIFWNFIREYSRASERFTSGCWKEKIKQSQKYPTASYLLVFIDAVVRGKKVTNQYVCLSYLMIGVEFTKTESKTHAFVRALSSVTKYTYLSKRQKLWVNVRWVQTCGNSCNERGQRKFSLLVLVMALLPAPSPSPRRRPRSPTPPCRSRPRSPVAGHIVSDASRRVLMHDTNTGQSF